MDPKAFREWKDMNLAEMAHFMGFSGPSTVHRHESGERQPDLETIKRYADRTEGAVTYEDWQRLRERVRAEKAGAT